MVTQQMVRRGRSAGAVLAGAVLFLTAFTPLAVVLALVSLPVLGWGSAAIIGGCLLVWTLFAAVMRSLRRLPAELLRCREVEPGDESVLRFTASCVSPVLIAAFAQESAVAVAGAAGLGALMMVIVVRGRLYQLNPVLTLIGYRLYQVTAVGGARVGLLSRARHLPQDAVLHIRPLTEAVAVDSGRPPELPGGDDDR